MDGVRIAAVMDPVPERAEALAAGCGARTHADLEPLLDEVDAVYVCTPPTFHRAQVEAAVTAGKHVYLEKPIATTIEDGRAIAEALSSSRARSMVGFNNRFRPAFRRWRDLARELGPPRAAWILRMAPSTLPPNANWRTTPGLLCGITIESASHDIDLALGARRDRLGIGSTASSLPSLEGFDDTLNAAARLDGGSAVTLSISWSSAVSTSSRGFVGSTARRSSSVLICGW